MKTWTEFIDKVRRFKRESGKTGLNAPALIRLLYMGAFDDIIDDETKKIPATERYATLMAEMLKAMGSKASLPKKRVTEVIGMNQIDGNANLMLWRYENNPFVQYDITRYCVTFLKSMGYERMANRTDDVLWIKHESPQSRTPVDVRYSWPNSFHPSVLPQYDRGARLLGVVGVVVKADKRIYQGHKESLVVVLFNGHEYTNEIRVWPGEDGKISEALKAQLKPGRMGLAVVRPKLWKERPGAALVHWSLALGG